MQKDSKTILGPLFLALILILLTGFLIATNILFSSLVPSLMLLLVCGGIGVVMLSWEITRPSSWKSSEGREMQSSIFTTANAIPHSASGVVKGPHPTKVRLRVERWEDERKRLGRLHSHACPRCGSHAGSICACRLRSRFY